MIFKIFTMITVAYIEYYASSAYGIHDTVRSVIFNYYHR